MKASVPVSKLVSLALEHARCGAVKEAVVLLNEAERLAYKSGSSQTNLPLKLINAVRDKFGLHMHEALVGSANDALLLGAGVKEPLPGVSIVTCSKNRTQNLIKAMRTWLPFQEIKEVVIVDWSSDVQVVDALGEAGVQDERIVVARVEDEPRWILSYAFNVGFRLAKHEQVLKLDADITLDPKFFQQNVLHPGSFIAGDWQKADKGQEYINGFFYVYLRDLHRVKGFNEYITTYGWDDDDIYLRLKGSGLERRCVDTKTIFHLPHDDQARIGQSQGNPESAIEQLQKDTLYKIRTNRYLSLVMPPWDSNRNYAPFTLLSNERRVISLARRKHEMAHYVIDDIRLDAEYYAAVELMSWRFGPRAYHIDKVSFRELMGLKLQEHLTNFDFEIAILGGRAFQQLSRNTVVLQFASNDTLSGLSALVRYLNVVITRADTSVYIMGINDVASREAFKALKQPYAFVDDWISTEGLKDISLERLEFEMGSGSRVVACKIRIAKTVEIPTSYRDVKSEKRKVYIDVQHGLGNRLRALASAAAIARKAERELIVVWVPDHHCECKLTDIFEYDGVVIDDIKDVPQDVCKYNYMELEPGAQKDEPINVDHPRDILIKSAFVLNHSASYWESENEELRRLTPSSAVRALVESVGVPDSAIGVHVRMEAGPGLDQNSYDSDRNWSEESHRQIHYWRSKSHYSSFMSRIDSLIAESPRKKIFLATDLPANYHVFRTTYGERLLHLERHKFDRSKEQITYALADAILLSRSVHFLGSTWSSFSELALRLSTTIKVVEMSGKDF